MTPAELFACVVVMGRKGAIPRGAVIELRYVKRLHIGNVVIRDAITVRRHRALEGRV